MNFGIQSRLAALGLAVGLAGTLIVLITLNSQRQVTELRTQLNSVDLESSGIMDQFKESLRELNSAVLRYGADRDPAVWETALNANQKLNVWINEQQATLRARTETVLLRQIQTACGEYLRVIWDFHAKVELLNGQSPSLIDFEPVREQSQRLFDLGQSLARTHFESHNKLLRHANQSLEELHISMLILLGLLFISGAAMAVAVYRHLIAPLRVELIKTRDFAKRHEKLASLGLVASDVANEVRHPLTSIKIGMFMQKKKFQPGTSERADAEVVEREILRLERILDDFLMFTDRLRRN